MTDAIWYRPFRFRENEKRTKKAASGRNRHLHRPAVPVGDFPHRAAWLILDYQGGSLLSEKLEAVPERMQDFTTETQEAESLQAGELRYQGKTYAYKKDVMTFLFMGIDRSGEMEASKDLYEGGQADALFLAVIDPEEKAIRVIGINRDTMTQISVYDRNGLYAGNTDRSDRSGTRLRRRNGEKL